MARASQEEVPKIVAHRVMGSTLFTLGEFERASAHFDKTLGGNFDPRIERVKVHRLDLISKTFF